MSNLKALVVDDESSAIDVIKSLIAASGFEIEIIGTFTDPRKVTMSLVAKADILFIDVQMPYLNGFELLAKMGSINAQVIFTTAHDTYALDALKIGACDYLLKPVDRDDLHSALEKVQKARQSQNSELPTLPENRICLPTSSGFRILETTDIIRLKSESNYTYVYCNQIEKPYLVSRTLKVFETHLNSSTFIRVNQSNIININYIIGFDKSQGGIIEMKNGEEITLSPTYRKAFYALLSSSLI